MLKKALKIKKEYDQAKFAAVEHVINNFESRNSKIIVTILFIGICLEWVYAVFSSNGLEKTSETYGNAPFAFPFLTSYFFFFLGSKLMFKPTKEELSDDTSLFAIFSACDRRSRRSLVSIFLSIFHTLIFVFYLLSKDLK